MQCKIVYVPKLGQTFYCTVNDSTKSLKYPTKARSRRVNNSYCVIQ